MSLPGIARHHIVAGNFDLSDLFRTKILFPHMVVLAVFTAAMHIPLPRRAEITPQKLECLGMV
jgi:hypothetical protein